MSTGAVENRDRLHASKGKACKNLPFCKEYAEWRADFHQCNYKSTF